MFNIPRVYVVLVFSSVMTVPPETCALNEFLYCFIELTNVYAKKYASGGSET